MDEQQIKAIDLWSSARRSKMSALSCCCCDSRCLATDLSRFRDAIACSIILLLHAIAECFARLSHGLGVCPSVRHTAVLCQKSAS